MAAQTPFDPDDFPAILKPSEVAQWLQPSNDSTYGERQQASSYANTWCSWISLLKARYRQLYRAFNAKNRTAREIFR